jgi:hypothetical protein
MRGGRKMHLDSSLTYLYVYTHIYFALGSFFLLKKGRKRKKKKMRGGKKSRKNTVGRLITIGGIAVIGAIVAFMVFLQIEASKNNDFKRAYEQIVIDTNALTKEYTAEEAKWLAQDNSTLIKVIDQYQPRYGQLVERAKSLDTPEKYVSSRDYLVSTIDLEKQSYLHFRDYLETGNQTEYVISSDMLTKSLEESANADAAIKVAG